MYVCMFYVLMRTLHENTVFSGMFTFPYYVSSSGPPSKYMPATHVSHIPCILSSMSLAVQEIGGGGRQGLAR